MVDYLYFRAPTAEKLAATGGFHGPEDYPEPEVDLWEENWDMFIWFRNLLTQFRYTNGIAIGLDYGIAYRDMDDMGLAGDVRESWKGAMRLMERTALRHLNSPD